MRIILLSLLIPATLAMAQDNPYSAFSKRAFGQGKAWLIGSAEKMPEAQYSFKPTDSVRSFGQLVGHVADAQYMFCSAVLGEKNPSPGIEASKTSKADLVAALKASFAYCDKAYDGLTDDQASQTVKMFGGDMPKPVVLIANNMHDFEHYGNMVTYMRLKNVTPPSSESDSPPPPPQKKGH